MPFSIRPFRRFPVNHLTSAVRVLDSTSRALESNFEAYEGVVLEGNK
jgi:hypothetical protein